MCYGRNDTTWQLTPETGHFSGKRDVDKIEFTVAKYTPTPTLYAIVNPLIGGSHVVLSTVNVSANTKVSLLSQDGSSVPLGYTKDGSDIVVDIPNFSSYALPLASAARALKFTEAQ